MMMADGEALKLIIEIINGLGVTGLLIVLLVFFIKGDLLSRKVYKELTESLLNKFVDRVCKEMASSIESAVSEAIDCVLRDHYAKTSKKE